MRRIELLLIHASGAVPSVPRGLGVGAVAGLVALLVGLGPGLGPGTSDGSEPADPGTVRHDGLMAVEVVPVSPGQRELALGLSLDLWSESPIAPRPVVVLDPTGLAELRAAGVETRVVLDDIQAPVDAERARLQSAEPARPGNWYADYRDYETVDAYLDTLVAEYPRLASVEQIGSSVEGRRIRGLRISASEDAELSIMLNGGQHAREWIGVMVPVCIADRLLGGYASDERVRALLDRSELLVVPMVNPDGYQHTWDGDRYWRKNRSGEHGVDLNRNFGTAWGGQGSSADPRSQVYRGPSPFSEPESRAMRAAFERETFDLHIDFHSFSQLILHPWGYKSDAAPDADLFAVASQRMAAAMLEPHGEPYRILSAAKLYPASGTFMDWSYAEREALSFVIELRPKGAPGFVLPPEQIVPTCDEAYAGTLALAEWKAQQH